MASILPTSLRNDETFIFLEETIKRVFESADLSVLLLYILDNTPPDALYYLAKQFNVLGLRGYMHATTDEEKRNLLRSAIDIHRHAGTPYAIKRALASIGLEVNRIEEGIGNYYLYNGQYSYNGAITYGSDGHWAYFRVYINTQPGTVISASQLQEAVDVINEFKNVRSHLYDITVTTNTITDYVEPSDMLDIGASVGFIDGSGAMYNGAYFYNGAITYGEGLQDSMAVRYLVPDLDAQAFIDAAGITDSGQMQALQYLVSELKAQGLWSKMQALYPMVGGTAQAHKLNLKDPRDLEAAFRINYVGGIAHSALGVQGNGVNGYGDTFFSPRTHAGINNLHMSIFTPSNSTAVGVQIGVFSNSFGNYSFNAIRYTGASSGFMNNNATILSPTLSAPVNGFYVNTRTSSSGFKVFKDGSMIGESTSIISAQTNPLTMYICACHGQNAPISFSTHIISFASLGQGLTDAESVAFSSIVNTYQFMLGR